MIINFMTILPTSAKKKLKQQELIYGKHKEMNRSYFRIRMGMRYREHNNQNNEKFISKRMIRIKQIS